MSVELPRGTGFSIIVLLLIHYYLRKTRELVYMDWRIPMKPKYSLSSTEMPINNILIFTSIFLKRLIQAKGITQKGLFSA